MELVWYLFGVVSGMLALIFWAAFTASGKESRKEEARETKDNQ